MTRVSTSMDDQLHQYLVANQPAEHPVLAELRQAAAGMQRGRMQIAPEQGHFLAFMVRLTGARRILEIGTFTGYSSIVMALAMPPDGRIVTCDVSEAWTRSAREAWGKAGVADRIELRIGAAIETMHSLERERGEGPFELVFVDADKESYDGYYESALRLVCRGGLIMLDNMFRDGRVADEAVTHESVTTVRALNARIARDERVDRVLVSIGDGMTLVRKR